MSYGWEKSGISGRKCPLLGCKCAIWYCHVVFLEEKVQLSKCKVVFLGEKDMSVGGKVGPSGKECLVLESKCGIFGVRTGPLGSK